MNDVIKNMLKDFKNPHSDRMRWKGTEDEPEMSSLQEQEDKQETISIVELYDDDGEKAVFEVLDIIEYNDGKYHLITPYYVTKEEYGDKPADVFVMKEFICKNDEPMLEPVEDEKLCKKVYDLFKVKHAKEFKFMNSQEM